MTEKLLEHIACTSLHTELSTTDFPVHLSLMLSLSAFKLQNQPKIVIVPTKNDHSAISIAMNKGFRMVVATNDFIQYMYMFRFDHPSIWHGLVKYNQFIGAVISTSIKCINYFQC